MQMNKKTKRGSILAYALIILAAMVAVVSAIAASSTMEKKSAVSTENSVQAYQVADSGIQLALKRINNSLRMTWIDPDADVSLGNVFSSGDGTVTCNGDGSVTISGDGNESGVDDASITLYFYEDKDAQGLVTSCGDYNVGFICSIKSVGKYKNTIRAAQTNITNCKT
jgi:hypothetical protein